ncbi:helicase associated domain-containing protein [Streptomyces viridosporus]|uniref:helicase associated domain-containing protein n=1 Tax=Streptomyces viridosporus TaxID=67581 RepID=UPI0026B54E3D
MINPEHEHWRRGVEAAVIYHRLHGDLRVPFTYRVPDRDDQEAGAGGWPAALAGFPLGQWIADNRRFYARGGMDENRVEQLEKLGMVWSHYDVAWEEGLAAARGWAAEHGHLLAPLDATHQGYRVGIWLKNQRAAARRAAEIEQRRASSRRPARCRTSDASSLRTSTPPGARPGRWSGNAASTSPGSTSRPATRCSHHRATSCTRAKTSDDGYARSGSVGTSSPVCSSGCASRSSASNLPT